ncbi:DUF402 domain-containing protein [Abyssicoccus albus]|uniref:DUF402 domain-containing protein n=1 Tax=Abyssicoccus albus TaxID=1817405 RepID=A0A3N5CBW4_9BACL|nr:DUF402 domain-containing protein [Abyssicoccus albus]RPF57412.1 hypothetical protein EDD62_0030 [Abyssicoccus albus]
MKIKYTDKRNWRRITEKDYIERAINDDIFSGIIAMIYVKKVREPLTLTIVNQQVKVIDDHYKWLQLVPNDHFYSMTVMFDNHDRILQYYIDINYENIPELGNCRTHDLYLDVLVLPDGQFELVDEEDLQRALDDSLISQQDFNTAYEKANHIMDYVRNSFNEIKSQVNHAKMILDHEFQMNNKYK